MSTLEGLYILGGVVTAAFVLAFLLHWCQNNDVHPDDDDDDYTDYWK